MPDPITPRSIADIEAELEAGHDNFDSLLPPEDDDPPPGDTNLELSTSELAAIEEASRKGWVPKDKYKGDPAKWVDAKTFNERGERFAKNLIKEVDTLKQKLADFEGTKAKFIKFHEEQIARKDAELKEAISSLRVQRTAAIREGEDELAVELEDRIDLLKDQQKELKAIPAKQEEPTAKPSGPDMTDPVVEDWIEDGNQWFRDDPKLRDYALKLGETMIKEGETVRGRRFLDKVAEAMKIEFPRRFGKQPTLRTPQSAVEGGSASGSASSGGKTARDLPPEDRKLMREFIENGWTTEEKFLKDYFSSNRRVHS